jgi:hypothetical protein
VFMVIVIFHGEQRAGGNPAATVIRARHQNRSPQGEQPHQFWICAELRNDVLRHSPNTEFSWNKAAMGTDP